MYRSEPGRARAKQAVIKAVRMADELVYKILRAAQWRDAQAQGAVTGSADDARDGFIHLSTGAQVAGTLERHFAGETGLVVLEIAVARLGDTLKWEPSRGGALFPHCYGVVPLEAIVRTMPGDASSWNS
jgi:uncharacterized protein (DUF952 family)